MAAPAGPGKLARPCEDLFQRRLGRVEGVGFRETKPRQTNCARVELHEKWVEARAVSVGEATHQEVDVRLVFTGIAHGGPVNSSRGGGVAVATRRPWVAASRARNAARPGVAFSDSDPYRAQHRQPKGEGGDAFPSLSHLFKGHE